MNGFHRIGWAALALLVVTSTDAATEVMPAAPARYFNDYAHVVKVDTANRLNSELEQFEKDTSSQVVVAVFPAMQSPSSLEDYVHRMFQAWQIGQKSRNNGVLLAVFVQDRKMRIEVGYGLEGALPDARAKQIIENDLAPHFRKGDYDGGLEAGVADIFRSIRGEFVGNGGTAGNHGNNQIRAVLMVVGFVAVLIAIIWLGRLGGGMQYGRRGRRRSGWIGGGWGGGGWGGGGGFGGGGFGGGGFGGGFSGGGGSSGGGGASGGW